MSTLLIKRANRVVLLSVAAVMVLSLLAPIVTLANTDIVAGDSAVVSNPDGANLRSDMTLEAATITAELPAGTTVYVTDGPFFTDTGSWVWVATDGYGPGYVTTALLQRIGNDELAEANGVSSEEPVAGEDQDVVTSELAWLDPIDKLVVVDHTLELPAEGLAVRTGMGLDAPILGYAPVGTSLDVTSEREWAGDMPFVRVNFHGVGGYVDGRFIELVSETVIPEPVVEEVIWLDDPVDESVVQEPAVAEPVVEEPVVAEPVVEDPIVEDPIVDEEVASIDGLSTDATLTDEAVGEADSAETDAIEDQVAEEVAPVDEVSEDVASEDVVTEEAAVETEAAAETTLETDVETDAATAAVVETEIATEAPVETEAATEALTEEVQITQAAPIATTADAFNADMMIGSATVTGTSSGLLCRTEPSPSAPVLMTLSEGTKVLVSAEAVNGYLGIDCGGLQGFADVNYLWSGGAADAEINASRLNVVVTGTGNGLNCRNGAGLNHGVITTVFDGTSLVTRGAASNGWTPVTCGGQNGFVSTTWIAVAAGSSSNAGNTSGNAAAGSAVVNTGGDGLYCRTGAGTSYGIITVLRHGSSVSVRGANQGEWVPVTCGGSAGFAHSSFLNVSTAAASPAPSTPTPGDSTPTGSVKVANTGGMGLNCRSGAGTSHGVITTLSLGQAVQTRGGSTNGWTAVVCGGTNGFVSSEFVTGASAGTTPTAPSPNTPVAPAPAPSPSGMNQGDHAKTTAALNMRYSASLSASVSTRVDSGKVVQITGALSNDFYPVDYDGISGFMHKDYLVKTSEDLSKRGGSGTPAAPAPSIPAQPAPTPPPANSGTTPTGNAMVNYAMRYVGYPYVWATRGPASFDCSGFTYWVVLNVTGKNIGAGTWTQVAAGTPVSRDNLQPGDLVFFQNTYTAGLSHVGMYIGNGQFIHAQNEETGVVVSDLNSSYYGSRWYGAVRL